MKTVMYKTVLVTFLTLILSPVLNGQTAEELRGMLHGKRTPGEVMRVVDEVYQGRHEVPGLPKYKHWVRWAYWWSMHTQADGSFGNPRKMNARALRQWPDQPGQNRNSNNTWSQIGPSQSTYASNGGYCAGNGYGRLDRIAFHPTDPNTIYVGAPYGGLWRTTNGGSSWSCLTDMLPNIGVAGIVVDHTDPDILYLLSGNGDDLFSWLVEGNGFFNYSDGIYKSTNGGSSWDLIFTFPEDTTQGFRMKQHPSDANTVYALTNVAVYRTEDAGVTWDSIFTGNFTDMEFHPTDHDTTYISGFAQYRYSFDKGDTWHAASGITFCSMRSEIAVSPDDPDYVWLLTGKSLPGNTYCGIFRSTNNGQDFSLINNSPNILSGQSNYDLVIAVHPANDNILLAGAITLWRSTNGATTQAGWTNVTPYFETTGSQQGTLPSNYVHPDIHDLAFNPLDNKVYCTGDGGVYFSSNGVTWTNITQGIITTQTYNINASPINAGRLSIGQQDNGVKMRISSSSQDFLHISSGDGFEAVTDPGNANIVSASINQSLWYFDEYDETDGTKLVNSSGQWFKPVRFKPDNGNVLYYGNSPLTIRYIDSSNPTTTLPGSASWTIETCADVPGRIYFAGGDSSYHIDPDGSFYVSFNGSTSSDMSTTPGFPSQLLKITDIAVYPDQCHKVAFSMGGYIAGNKVFYSTVSGGGSWQNISYNLPNVPVYSLAIDASGNFYAGTEIGVFVKAETATEWAPFYNGLPRVPVSSLVIQQGSGRIIAATFGRGVWHAFLASGCSLATNVSSNLEGHILYSADQSIVSTSTISGGVGTEVTFSAGDYIRLDPGFRAYTGNTFFALLDGCVD